MALGQNLHASAAILRHERPATTALDGYHLSALMDIIKKPLAVAEGNNDMRERVIILRIREPRVIIPRREHLSERVGAILGGVRESPCDNPLRMPRIAAVTRQARDIQQRESERRQTSGQLQIIHPVKSRVGSEEYAGFRLWHDDFSLCLHIYNIPRFCQA